MVRVWVAGKTVIPLLHTGRVQSRLNVLGADGAPIIPMAHVEGWGPLCSVSANPAIHT